MIAAVLNTQACWLVPHAPNTNDSVRVGVRIPVEVLRALTGPSSRRPQAIALQLSLEWTAEITGAAFATARNASQTAQDEPCLVPVWFFAVAAAAALPVTSGLTLAWTRDWSSWAINPGSFAAYDFKAPLLFGRMTQPPRMAGKNGDKVLADFSFEEDGLAGYALTAPATVDATFATVSGFVAPVFPFVHEGSVPPAPGLAVTDVQRSQNGPGRIKSSTFFPQDPERLLEANFRFKTAAAAAELLGWWARRAGVTDPHWVAETQTIGTLSVDVAAAATVLNFAQPIAPIGGNRAIALYVPGTLELARISAATTTSITTAAGLAHAWPAAWTNVTLAMLARHVGDELVMEFRRAEAGWIADATLTWRECAAEYTVPEGETRGTTIGRLPGVWWGFQIDLDYNGAVESTYLTNWQSGATVNAIDWAYNDCSFSALTQSIDLEDDECTFNLHGWPGCPMENWLPGKLSATGRLTIYRSDVSPAGVFSNFRQVWAGDMSTPEHTAQDYSIRIVGANALFSRKGPKQKLGVSCGTDFCKPRCALLLSDWTFSAVVTQIVGFNVVVGPITRTNSAALPAGFGFTDWFSLGYLEWTSGGKPRRAGIPACSAYVDGMTIAVDRQLGFAVGATVHLVPACDRQGFTCRAYDAETNEWGKFDNYDNFRGFEEVPAVSPGFVIPPKATAPAKK